MKSAIVTFFDSYPPRSGSGRVCCDFHKSWPGEKKLFQLSTKKVRESSIETILIKKNNPFYKILNLVFLIKNIRKYLDDKKISLVINTTSEKKSIEDSWSLRRAALNNKIPYFTTLAGAKACTQAINSLKKNSLKIKRIQEL